MASKLPADSTRYDDPGLPVDARKRVATGDVLDGRAALLAGLAAGGLSLAFIMAWYAIRFDGPFWVPARFIAATVLGRETLNPTLEFDAGVFLVGVAVYLLAAILFAFVIAFIFHRWGILIGLLGGGVMGLALFGINVFAFARLFPWMVTAQMGGVLLAHIAYGALTGGLYELLENDGSLTDEPFLRD